MKLVQTSIIRPTRAFAALCVLIVLTGCYLPVRYDAEIVITREGYYEFYFDGYVAKVPLYQKLRDREITPTEEQAEVEIIRTDFERDSGTKAFEYFRQGHFRVQYQREGDLLRSRTFTFFRRNENFLSLSYNNETGQIAMSGKSLSQDVKQQIRDQGLDSSGELRVISDANVTGHNASSVRPFPSRGPGFNMYTWRLNNIFAATPSLRIQAR